MDSEKDLETVLLQYQRTNKLIRSRAIALAIILIVVIGFIKLSENQEAHTFKLWHSINLLQKLRDTTDTKTFIQKHELELERNLYWEIGLDKIYYTLQQSNYSDKSAITEAIDFLQQQRISLIRSTDQSSINVVGANVPASPWLYISPLIILLLYHDTTQLILFRKRLRNMLNEQRIPFWKRGAELFGVEFDENSTSYRFVQITSGVLIGILLTLPIIPSIAGIQFYAGKKSDYNYLFLAGLFLSPCILFVDMCIIYYSENIFRIQDFVKWYLGKKGEHISFTQSLRWFLLPMLLFISHLVSQAWLDDPNNIPIMYFISVLVTVCCLPLALMWKKRRSDSKAADGLLFVGAVICLYWFFCISFIWSGIMDYSHADPEEMTDACWFIFLASVPLSYIYIRLARHKRSFHIQP